MLEATFSPLIPTDDSEEFYKNFYYQYSFIQINDAFIAYTSKLLSEEEQCNLVSCLNQFNEDQNYEAIRFLASGIINPAIMRRRKENRGISIELFNSLKSQKVNPLDWYDTNL